MKVFSRRVVAIVALPLVVAIAGPLIVGFALARPIRATIGAAPPDLGAEPVTFVSASGATLRGWFSPGRPGSGAVLLMHGVRSDRRSMVGRAQFLHRAGYAVLLFDFQAHGESTGDRITFGARESMDARSALDLLRSRTPGERVGAIGESLGGASALLAEPRLAVDALVIEAVYPTIEPAIAHRIEVNLGPFGSVLAPVLTPMLMWQLEPRLGISASALRPIDRIGGVGTPLLLIAGAADRYTPLDESRAIFAHASAPKEFWIVPGAGHVDLHSLVRGEYERRVSSFFAQHLYRTLRDSAHSRRRTPPEVAPDGHVGRTGRMDGERPLE